MRRDNLAMVMFPFDSSQSPCSGRAGTWGLCGVLAAMVACSPALDWRDLKPVGTGLSAQMPCRASTHSRPVVLASRTQTLNLLSCSAADSTWGLSWTEVADPQTLGDILVAMRQASLANIGARETSLTAYAVPGASTHLQSGRFKSEGRRPDGSVVMQDVVLFTRGLTVFQATVLTTKPQAGAADEFFGALRFSP
jgi:hypothetical protein